MELSLQLDTLGMVEIRYLRGRERYRDWPQFQLFSASRQARVFAYMSHEVAEQLHQQILMVEAAVGMDGEDEAEEENGSPQNGDEHEHEHEATPRPSERDSSAFSPALAQALKQLNELARQRLGDSSSGGQSSETLGAVEDDVEAEDALEQLQEAFTQMMEVVRELAEEMATDALKITGRFKCARTNIEFVPRPAESDDDDDDDDDEQMLQISQGEGVINIEVELVMVLQLFEEGRARPDDPPAIELQLDVDDFERLHDTLDLALDRERRSRRRR